MFAVPVPVEIDEARRDNETGGLDVASTLEGLVRDDIYPTIDNADVADRIQPRLRIHDAATLDHNVVCRAASQSPGNENEGGEAR